MYINQGAPVLILGFLLDAETTRSLRKVWEKRGWGAGRGGLSWRDLEVAERLRVEC